MPINAALLHPSNRLLSGGTTDFATFGAQPTTVIIASPETGGSGYVTAFSSRGGGEQAAGDAADAAALKPIYGGEPALATQSLDGTIAQPSAFQPDAPHSLAAGPAAPAPAVSIPFNPVPIHEGALVAGTRPVASDDSQIVAASPFHAPVLDAIAPTLSPEAFALAGGLGGSTLAPLLSDVAEITGTVGTLAVGAPDALVVLGAPVAAATDGIADLVASLPNDVPSVLAPGADLADGAVAAVGSETAASLGTAQDSVAATVLPLVDHLAAGEDTVPAAVTDVLAGNDPVGGIATLTAMVGSADVFELSDGGVPAAPDPVASALDAIPADAEATAPLLGDHGDGAHDMGDLTHQTDTHLGIAGL